MKTLKIFALIYIVFSSVFFAYAQKKNARAAVPATVVKPYFSGFVNEVFGFAEEAKNFHDPNASLVKSIESALEAAAKGDLAQLQKERKFANVLTQKSAEIIEEDIMIGEKIKAKRFYPAQGKASCDIVFYHGGGFVFGGLNSHLDFIRGLCGLTKANLLAIDYAPAPEADLEQIISECEAGLNWMMAHQNKRSIFLMGDSAGGHLALYIGAKRKKDIDTVVAIYPVVDLNADYSKNKFQNYALSDKMMKLFVSCAAKNKNAAELAELSPINSDLSDFPALLMVLASDDILCDKALEFAKKVSAQNQRVRFVKLVGAVHGSASNMLMEKAFKANLNECAEFILRLAPYIKVRR